MFFGLAKEGKGLGKINFGWKLANGFEGNRLNEWVGQRRKYG